MKQFRRISSWIYLQQTGSSNCLFISAAKIPESWFRILLHLTLLVGSLHWLPVQQRKDYKIQFRTKIHLDLQVSYDPLKASKLYFLSLVLGVIKEKGLLVCMHFLSRTDVSNLLCLLLATFYTYCY